MAKFSNTKRIPAQLQNELFIRLAKAWGCLKGSTEAANFIRDLFSEQEILMLSRRLQIADLLQKGLTYKEIRKDMRVGENTIARIQLWLDQYGEGFRAVFKRTQGKSLNNSENGPLSWRKIKKKYPIYFWPQLLLEEIVRSANQRERQRLLKVVEGIKEKNKLTKNLLNILNNKNFHTC